MIINMKKIILHASVFVLAFGNAFASVESPKLFPMSDITVGMSSKEFMDKYPAEKFLFEPKTDEQGLVRGIAIYEFRRNKFWDMLWVGIDHSNVEVLHYLKSGGNNRAIKNIKPVFEHLKQQLGETFEKKVTYGETGKTRCAMYIWERENDVVVFAHSPVSQYKKGDFSFRQLTIAQKVEYIGMLYENRATDSLPEDELLWADAMGEEEKGTFPNLWVCASIALCAFCAIAYLIWRKRK